MASMFRAAPNPYDDIVGTFPPFRSGDPVLIGCVGKATHEDLLSEDWDANLQICDRVSEEGEQGYV